MMAVSYDHISFFYNGAIRLLKGVFIVFSRFKVMRRICGNIVDGSFRGQTHRGANLDDRLFQNDNANLGKSFSYSAGPVHIYAKLSLPLVRELRGGSLHAVWRP